MAQDARATVSQLRPALAPPAAGRKRVPIRDDEALEDIARELEQTGWAADLYDAEWRLVWFSDQFRMLMNMEPGARPGIGKHLIEGHHEEPWKSYVTAEGRRRWLAVNAPYVAHDTPGGVDTLKRHAEPELAGLFDGMEQKEPPLVWTSTSDFVQPGQPPAAVRCLALRHEVDGRLAGTSFVYGAALPATILALVGRGDAAMFARMAELFEPGRRAAAILFVDICSSSVLSRRLPTSAYFTLIRQIMSAVDQVIANHQGIVGKHVGDGATGFFLRDQLGGESATARAAVEAAREVLEAARAAAAELAREGVPLSPDEVEVRAGLHWGESLYMGQVVTGGRLEVTALGDEVNEAARIEQSAEPGAVYASKGVLERLAAEDAAALGIELGRLRYRSVADLSLADDKARRDAGGVAVADIAAPADADPPSRR